MKDYFEIFEKAIAYQNKKRKEDGEQSENICYFCLNFSEGVSVQKIKNRVFKISLMVPGERVPEIYEVETKTPSLLDIDPFKKYCIECIILEEIYHNKELASAVYDY
jgi:hypothetical protein